MSGVNKVYMVGLTAVSAVVNFGFFAYSCYNWHWYGSTAGTVFGVGLALLVLSTTVGMAVAKAKDPSLKLTAFSHTDLFKTQQTRGLFTAILASAGWYVATTLGFETSLEMLAVVGAIGGAISQLLCYPASYDLEFNKSKLHFLSVPLIAGVGACSMLFADTVLTSLASTAGLELASPEVMVYSYIMLSMFITGISGTIISAFGNKMGEKGVVYTDPHTHTPTQHTVTNADNTTTQHYIPLNTVYPQFSQ